MKFVIGWLKKHKPHFIGWGILIGIEVLVAWKLEVKIASPFSVMTLYAINICFFYLFAGWLLERHYNRFSKFNWRLSLAIIICCVIFTTIKVLLDGLITNEVSLATVQSGHFLKQATIHIYRYIEFVVLASAYFYALKYVQEKNDRYAMLEADFRLQLKKNKSKAETEALFFNRWRKQFDPHLVFSTLNYYHTGIELKQPLNAEALVHLSAMLRYNLRSEMLAKEVLLSEEIKQLRIVMALRAATEKFTFDIEVKNEEQLHQVSICPMFLTPLANTIVSLQGHCQASLSINIQSDKIDMVFNNLAASIAENRLEEDLQPFKNQLLDFYAGKANWALVEKAGFCTLQIAVNL